MQRFTCHSITSTHTRWLPRTVRPVSPSAIFRMIRSALPSGATLPCFETAKLLLSRRLTRILSSPSRPRQLSAPPISPHHHQRTCHQPAKQLRLEPFIELRGAALRGLVGRVYGDRGTGTASRTVTGRGLINGPSAGTGGHCYSRRLIS